MVWKSKKKKIMSTLPEKTENATWEDTKKKKNKSTLPENTEKGKWEEKKKKKERQYPYLCEKKRK